MAKNKKLTSNAVKAKKEELKASMIKEVVIGGDTYEFKVDRKFIKSKEVAFTNDLISFLSFSICLFLQEVYYIFLQ